MPKDLKVCFQASVKQNVDLGRYYRSVTFHIVHEVPKDQKWDRNGDGKLCQTGNRLCKELP